MDLINNTGSIADKFFRTGYLENAEMPVLIAALVIALLTCFLGLKVFRIWMGVLGLAVGLGAGYWLPVNLFHVDKVIGLVIGIVLGILLAVLAYKLYLASVMLYCWLMGALLAAYFIRPDSLVWWALCFAIGLAAGLIGLKFAEPIVIMITGLNGGITAAIAAAYLISFQDETLTLAAGAVLAVAGIVVQFILEGRRRGKQAVKKAETIREAKSVETEIEAARSVIFDEDGKDSKDDIEIVSGDMDGKDKEK